MGQSSLASGTSDYTAFVAPAALPTAAVSGPRKFV